MLPNPCLLCARPVKGEQLCSGCAFSLPYLEPSGYRCDLCALPLAEEASYCGRCLSEPPPFERCRAAFRYDYPLDYLIHHFKYHRQLAFGRALANLLAEHLRAARAETHAQAWPEMLLPVPLHWSRRLRRGFNQTELMAADLGRALALPVHSRLCRRNRRTPAQQGLSRKQRERNLRRAFSLTPGASEILAGRRVALLDDVVTTTSTARELSRLLLNAGAREVELWALARTPNGDYSVFHRVSGNG